MTPDRAPLCETLKRVFVGGLALIAFGVTPAVAGSTEKADFDALSRQGFEHFYSLEYDQAIQDFQKAWEARPDEPKAINHLLEARLFQQLYQYNALDTMLYLKQRFLTSKQDPIEPATKQPLLALAERAMMPSDKRLKSNPKY